LCNRKGLDTPFELSQNIYYLMILENIYYLIISSSNNYVSPNKKYL